MRKGVRTIVRLPRNIVVRGINFYQATLSPDHGPLSPLYPYGFCPQTPSCSEYAKTAIAEHGVTLGGLMTLRRLLSCHPWKNMSKEKMRVLIER